MFFFLVLCAALGLPYLTSQWSNVGQMFGGGTTPTAAVGANPAAETARGMPPPASTFGAVSPAPVATNLTPVVDMAEAIRFNVTAAWILGRWPRVTAGLPDADQQGYRVPLVTGTRDDDLAGSLTYYFNKQQRCRRITFQGTTGDARRLVALVTKRFGFVQHTTNDPSLLVYQSRWNGRAISELHIRPARVVRASDPQSRFEVLLALNDPDAS
jgi:hypothetical protein